MRFTITWSIEARKQLTDLWLMAKNRRLVTQQANHLEKELAFDADQKGKPASEGLRRFIEPPLSILYTANRDDCIVEIVGISILRSQ
jgi:mRNA-degrading endonuclease RelE of RelBE toxin-antitoxin system